MLLLALSAFTINVVVAAEPATVTQEFVTYEEFGAVGDGLTDDLPAICKAHDHANEKGLPVRSKPGVTYHLGRKALTAIIATDTNWSTSKFIIDDSKGVENHNRSLFEVRSLLKPIQLKIETLKRGQTQLDIRPAKDCLVYVANKQRKIFIRRGLNQNDGTSQQEVFLLKMDGTIVGAIDWDYERITQVTAQPLDEKTLFVRGGIFTNIANQSDPSAEAGYWARNILIARSKTVIEGVTHRVTGERDRGNPYSGFLEANRCANIMLRNCMIDARKTYSKIGNAGKRVAMGTYGYRADLVVDFRLVQCRMGNDIHDRSRWGVVATNFMKNFLVEDCTLSRVDVHMGVSGSYIIRRSTIGHAGINAIGQGNLIIEDSTIQSADFLSFRDDYGSTWDGTVLIRHCRWSPPPRQMDHLVMFTASNDGMHDFGYPCHMPKLIKIEGLQIDDATHSATYKGASYFNDPIGKTKQNRPFPYRLTEKMEISGIKTASKLPLRICDNPEVANAIQVMQK